MPAEPIARTRSAENHHNLLLRSLRPGDAALLRPHLRRVVLAPGDIVAAAGAPLERALFPETVVVSVGDGQEADTRPDAGMVGHDGMIGWSLLLGCPNSLLSGVVRIRPGSAVEMDAARLMHACRVSSTLHASLLRFVDLFMRQMATTIASSSDGVERRVARWLLMLHDRSDADAFAVTHDHIGAALHVRRASVTDCFHLLEGDGILKCTRGRIVIRDRTRLEHIAGSSYGLVEAQYANEIGQFGKGGSSLRC